ncbi:MAG: hypothetical protein QOK34_1603 [Gaiellaceae bacterium]|nr:hypothetical protein [Gaiellaceae bacterium]
MIGMTADQDAAFRGAADGVSLNGNSATSGEHDSWQPVPLGPILEGLRTGAIVGPVPTLMRRTDGVALLYRAEVHSFAGEPESGKSWAAANVGARLVTQGDAVLYLDFEDNPASVLARMLALGATSDAILSHFTYIRPDTPSRDATIAALRRVDYVLAIIDGLSEAYGLLGLDSEKNADVATFLALLPRPIAAAGAAVVQIDHVTKAREGRGRYAIGAQHKLAGIAVAYSFEVIKPFSRLQAGTIKIRVEKDRHGHVRGHADGHVIALAQIEPQDNGERVTFTLNPPDTSSTTGTFRPTVIMERVSKFLEDNPGAGVNTIRGAIESKAANVDLAVRALVAEHHVEQRQEGQSKRHYVVLPYRQDSDRVPVSQPCPNRVPDTGGSDRVPVSPPIGDTNTGHGPRTSQDQLRPRDAVNPIEIRRTAA